MLVNSCRKLKHAITKNVKQYWFHKKISTLLKFLYCIRQLEGASKRQVQCATLVLVIYTKKQKNVSYINIIYIGVQQVQTQNLS